MIATKTRNNTLNSSRLENILNTLLGNMFNIELQYKSDEYPFLCDCYIKDFNLYIELNGHWTHGPHPFNPDSLEDQNKLNEIRAKQAYYMNNENKLKKNSYYVAERVWTQVDPLKLKYAKNNKLNYLALYNINDTNIYNLCKWNFKRFTGINIIDVSNSEYLETEQF